MPITCMFKKFQLFATLRGYSQILGVKFSWLLTFSLYEYMFTNI